MEDISEGHCVRSFLIEISENHKQSTEIFRGTAIGHKLLQWLPSYTAKYVRLHVLSSEKPPIITRFALYNVVPLEDESDD